MLLSEQLKSKTKEVFLHSTVHEIKLGETRTTLRHICQCLKAESAMLLRPVKKQKTHIIQEFTGSKYWKDVKFFYWALEKVSLNIMFHSELVRN